MTELLDNVAKAQEISHASLKATLDDHLTAAERVIAMHGRTYNVNSPTIHLPVDNAKDVDTPASASNLPSTAGSALNKVAKAAMLVAAIGGGAALPAVIPAIVNMFTPAPVVVPVAPVVPSDRNGSLLQFLEDEGFNRP